MFRRCLPVGWWCFRRCSADKFAYYSYHHTAEGTVHVLSELCLLRRRQHLTRSSAHVLWCFAVGLGRPRKHFLYVVTISINHESFPSVVGSVVVVAPA